MMRLKELLTRQTIFSNAIVFGCSDRGCVYPMQRPKPAGLSSGIDLSYVNQKLNYG